MATVGIVFAITQVQEWEQKMAAATHRFCLAAQELEQAIKELNEYAPHLNLTIVVSRKKSNEKLSDVLTQLAESDINIEKAHAAAAQREENARLKAEAAIEVGFCPSIPHDCANPKHEDPYARIRKDIEDAKLKTGAFVEVVNRQHAKEAAAFNAADEIKSMQRNPLRKPETATLRYNYNDQGDCSHKVPYGNCCKIVEGLDGNAVVVKKGGIYDPDMAASRAGESISAREHAGIIEGNKTHDSNQRAS